MPPTQTIYWKPSTSANVVAYEIMKSDTGLEGPYVHREYVLSDIPGPNWDMEKEVHFFQDDLVPGRYYQLRTMDRYGKVAVDNAPPPFQANNDPVPAPNMHFIALSSDMGPRGDFRYVSPGGSNIRGATVRVFRKIDWVTRQFARVVGTATTDASGMWPPIFVEPGETYTIVFHKPYEYGPTAVDIVV